MYQLLYKKSVAKDLRKLPANHRQAIVAKIQALAEHPLPANAVKLSGSDNMYRFRHGDYRVIYRLHKGELVVMVIKIGHRREVYRRL